MGRGRGDQRAAWPNTGMLGKDIILRNAQYLAQFSPFLMAFWERTSPSLPRRTDLAFINQISTLEFLILPFQRFSGTQSLSRCH